MLTAVPYSYTDPDGVDVLTHATRNDHDRVAVAADGSNIAYTRGGAGATLILVEAPSSTFLVPACIR